MGVRRIWTVVRSERSRGHSPGPDDAPRGAHRDGPARLHPPAVLAEGPDAAGSADENRARPVPPTPILGGARDWLSQGGPRVSSVPVAASREGEPEWRFPCAVANLARILLGEPADDPRPAGPVGLGSVAPPPRLSAAPRRLDGLRRPRPQARIPTRPVRHPDSPAQSGRPALCRPGRGVRPAPGPGRLAPSRDPPSRRSETQRPRLGAGFLTEGVLLTMPA